MDPVKAAIYEEMRADLIQHRRELIADTQAALNGQLAEIDYQVRMLDLKIKEAKPPEAEAKKAKPKTEKAEAAKPPETEAKKEKPKTAKAEEAPGQTASAPEEAAKQEGS